MEIVFSLYFIDPTEPFYVSYYNMERNTVIRVEIQGMEAFKDNEVYAYIDHVEVVKLMQMFSL